MKKGLLLLVFIGIVCLESYPQKITPYQLHHPSDSGWFHENLEKDASRLGLNPELLNKIEHELKHDSLIKSYYSYLRQNAAKIVQEPYLKEKQKGVKFLPTAREALQRMGTLALVYRIEGEEKYLERLNNEIITVCQFKTWNPSHFLDVAELSLAVSIGIAWCGEWLPDTTINLAQNKLRQQLLLSVEDKDEQNWWVNSNNNWNVVCHTGMVAAALITMDNSPELSTRIILRALDKIPKGLKSYSPDGAYNEGPTYWTYCSYYSAIFCSLLESSYGTNFAMLQTPGYIESATYRMMINSPTNQVFNYSDSDNEMMDLNTQGILIFFATKTGDSRYFDQGLFQKNLMNSLENGVETSSRFSPFTLMWLTQYEEQKKTTLPSLWSGDGINPVAVIRNNNDEESGFFLAVKGGKARVSHGHMDAGSFVFDLNGVRWSMDMGREDYRKARKVIGWRLFNNAQNSPRWTLLDKNNFGHSTLTINGQLHQVNGFAELEVISTEKDESSVAVNMTKVLQPYLRSCTRTFTKKGENILQIQDKIVPSDSTESITWSMMTTADVSIEEHGAILRSDEKALQLKIITPLAYKTAVTVLNPPPLDYDKSIEGLKKIEITIAVNQIQHKELKLVVELEGMN